MFHTRNEISPTRGKSKLHRLVQSLDYYFITKHNYLKRHLSWIRNYESKFQSCDTKMGSKQITIEKPC